MELLYMWSLGKFFETNGLQPSRYKLYVIMASEKEEIVNDEDTQSRPPNKMSCTECTIEKCMECGRDFRTYVPNSVCKLPDGNYATYADPQLLCPLCDPNQYGSFMNADLF